MPSVFVVRITVNVFTSLLLIPINTLSFVVSIHLNVLSFVVSIPTNALSFVVVNTIKRQVRNMYLRHLK